MNDYLEEFWNSYTNDSCTCWILDSISIGRFTNTNTNIFL